MSGLTQHALDLVFPFHFRIGADFQIRECSEELLLLTPDLGECPVFTEAWQVTRPVTGLVSFEHCCSYAHSAIELQSLAQPHIKLSGQFAPQAESSPLFITFLGRPVAPTMKLLLEAGVSLNKYPVHDYYLDVLLATDRQRVFLKDLETKAAILQQQAHVGDFAAAVSTADSIDELHLILATKTAELLKMDDVVVYRIEGDKLIQAAFGGSFTRENEFAKDPLVIELGQGVIGKCAEQRTSINVPDTSQCEDYIEDYIPGRSELAVPILNRGACLGVLDSESLTEAAYTPQIQDTLEKFAAIAGPALDAKLRGLRYNEQLVFRSVELESRDLALQSTAHEFRTPLTQLSTTIQLLSIHGDSISKEETKSLLSRLEEPIDRLTRLFNHLLHGGSNKRKEPETQPQPNQFELAPFLQKVARSCAEGVNRGKDLELELMDEDPIVIWTDLECLTQIVANLVTNALKYSESGTPVRMTASRVGSNAVITVEDFGIGIPDHLIGSIFEPFVRHPSATAMASGTGIGLSIVRKRLAEIQGKISVTSQVDKGTRFEVTVPIDLFRLEGQDAQLRSD